MNDVMWVRMVRNTLVAGEHLAAGTVVDMPARMAVSLIGMGKAVETSAPEVEDQTVMVEVPAQPQPVTPEAKPAKAKR
jgi:hypothetical protein